MNGEETIIELQAEELPLDVEGQAVSRRDFLTGTLVGGVAGLAVAAGTGGAVWKFTGDDARAALEAADAAGRAALEAANGDAQAAIDAAQAAAQSAARMAIEAAETAAQAAIEAERAGALKRVDEAKAEAQAEAQSALEAVRSENARLRALVSLYEGLEASGLDSILQAGIAALGMPLAAVGAGTSALREGVSRVKESLRSLEEALPSAQQSLLWLEGRVSALAQSVETLEASLGRAVGGLARHPLAQGIETFANRVLDYLPLGLGDKFRGTMAGLVTLVGGVDDLIEGVNAFLLEPLRVNWFSSREGEGIGSALVNPLVEGLIDPLEWHLGQMDALVHVWQREFLVPAERVLAERATARAQIIEYKAEHGLG
jgi:hypothetical protein